MNILHICMQKESKVFALKEGYELGNNISSKVLAFAFSLSAEIERSLISQRTMEAAWVRGRVEGRPRGLTEKSKELASKFITKQKIYDQPDS